MNMDPKLVGFAAVGVALVLVLLVQLFGADTVAGWIEWGGQKAVEGSE